MSLMPNVDGVCISIFESLQLEGLYVGDLLQSNQLFNNEYLQYPPIHVTNISSLGVL